MIRAAWHSGLLSVAATLGTACALLALSPESGRPLRGRLRDAVRPGAEALAHSRSWCAGAALSARRQLSEWSSPDRLSAGSAAAESSEDAATQSAAAESPAARLEARLIQLERELAAARRQLDAQVLVRASSPLLRTIAREARVIGLNRDAAGRVMERLLNLGAGAGIAREDLVLESLPGPSPTVAVTASPGATAGAAAAELLLLDQGSQAGITRDAPVGQGATLLGRIRECGQFTSSVQPVVDPEFRIGGQLVRSTAEGPVLGAKGMFCGGGARPCRLELLPGTEPVSVGDRVYTQEALAGESVILLIGQVTRAELRDGQEHWEIDVAPAATEATGTVQVLTVELRPPRPSARRDAPE